MTLHLGTGHKGTKGVLAEGQRFVLTSRAEVIFNVSTSLMEYYIYHLYSQ
jgi:hypothetical protein